MAKQGLNPFEIRGGLKRNKNGDLEFSELS